MTKRVKDPRHLKFIRQLPCLICGDNTSTEAAHLRFGIPFVAKPQTGMGKKPSDCWVVPLCGKHHRQQHTMGEYQFWFDHGHAKETIGFVCLALWASTENYEQACNILTANLLQGYDTILKKFRRHDD